MSGYEWCKKNGFKLNKPGGYKISLIDRRACMKLKNIWGNKKSEAYFRKTINIDREIDSAYARIFCDTGYELFINGNPVAHVDEWCNTRDYDVKLFMKKGINILAIHGINHGGHRGAAFELVVNGQTVAVSDKSWDTYDDERWGWILEEYHNDESYNATELNLSVAGDLQWWTKPGDDKSRVVPTFECSQFFKGDIPKMCESPYWGAKEKVFCPEKEVVDLLGNNYYEFAVSSHLPKILNYSKILNCTAEMTEDKITVKNTERYTGPSFIVDFGKEAVGYFRMRVKSEKCVSFRLHYGETFDEAMYEPSREVLLSRLLTDEKRVFEGNQEFESRVRVGFRYVRIEFFDCSTQVDVSEFAIRTALYPIARRGYFSCNDMDMTLLWQMGERTLRYCMQEYYIDAPKRDRLLWMGDLRLCAMINYYTFFDKALLEHSIGEFSKKQLPGGGIPSYLCEGGSMLWDYVAWYVIAFYDYYMYTGDEKILKKYKLNAYKAADYLTSLTNTDGLIDVPESPLGNSWMVELNEFVGVDPYLNELYLRAIKTVKLIAEITNDAENNAKYNEIIEKIERKVENLLSDDILVKLFDTIHHTQIQYELAEKDLYNGNYSRMIERINRFWMPMIASNSDCLHECTFSPDRIFTINEHHTDTPGYLSYCHAWTGAATVLLPMGIAGIRPVKPGYEEVIIKPQINIFDSFSCAVPTPKGDIAVKYEYNKFFYHLPCGVTAKLILNNEERIISGNGSYHTEIG